MRKVSPADFEFLARLMNEEGYKTAVGDLGIRTSLDAERYVRSAPIYRYGEGLGFNILELGGTGSPIGICGLVRREQTGLVELGYGLLEEVYGFGFATEAAGAVAFHGFERLGLAELFAVTFEHNSASRRVLDKLGMTFSHTTGERECVYRMDADEFRVRNPRCPMTARRTS